MQTIQLPSLKNGLTKEAMHTFLDLQDKEKEIVFLTSEEKHWLNEASELLDKTFEL